jgi:hypothetical protein
LSETPWPTAETVAVAAEPAALVAGEIERPRQRRETALLAVAQSSATAALLLPQTPSRRRRGASGRRRGAAFAPPVIGRRRLAAALQTQLCRLTIGLFDSRSCAVRFRLDEPINGRPFSHVRDIGPTMSASFRESRS